MSLLRAEDIVGACSRRAGNTKPMVMRRQEHDVWDGRCSQDGTSYIGGPYRGVVDLGQPEPEAEGTVDVKVRIGGRIKNKKKIRGDKGKARHRAIRYQASVDRVQA